MVEKVVDLKKKKDENKNRRIEKNRKQRHDIAKKEHIENTVNITKILFKIVIILFVIFIIFYISCRYIGTSFLIVKEYSIDYENLPSSFYGLKIVQISDVNYNKKTMPIKKIKDLINKVNSLNPDLIVFTGDLIYGDVTQNELNQLEQEFSKLNATLGKYAVFGSDKDSAKILIKNAGFTDIGNDYDLVYKNDYESILITGIDDNNPDIDSSFAYFNTDDSNQNIFTITLVHKPDMAVDITNNRDVNLILAGHSLGGQIYIPRIGGLIKSEGATKYVNSYYRVNKSDLYVSSGIGTRKYPYRLFNHPSISLFRLK